MSDWEDFCEAMGANPGSSEDYERMLDLLPGVPNLKHNRFAEDCHEVEPTALRFATFQEAAAWAKSGKGRAFTRSADGQYFVPKQPASRVGKTTSATLKTKSVRRVVWPNHEPNSSGWVPGSYATTEEEEKFAEKDTQEKFDFFYRTIERLAPQVWRRWNYKNRYPHSLTGLRSYLISYGRTNLELLELLSAFEWMVVRSNQWYISWELKNNRAHTNMDSLIYYEEAVKVIQAELSSRGDAVIREVQEELLNSGPETSA